jgi:hypothetical protein
MEAGFRRWEDQDHTRQAYEVERAHIYAHELLYVMSDKAGVEMRVNLGKFVRLLERPRDIRTSILS